MIVYVKGSVPKIRYIAYLYAVPNKISVSVYDTLIFGYPDLK